MKTKNCRKGVVAILICVLLVPLLFLLAFSIDYGYLLYVKTDLQRGVDQAVLAAARDLTPNANGEQDKELVKTRVREYVNLNLGDGFSVADDDIEIGKYDPGTIYGDLEILDTGTADTVRVVVRRDEETTTSVSLYFARLFGHEDWDVAAASTAILPPATILGPGTRVLPIAVQETWWNQLAYGEEVTVYGSGRIKSSSFDSGPVTSGNNGNGPNSSTSEVAGNWGTLDIGPRANSTQALREQINNGLSQNDLDSLYQQSVIPTSEYIDASADIDLNGDTGLSAGMASALEAAIGQTRIAPIYGAFKSQGGNLEFQVTGWVAVTMADVTFNGASNSSVVVQKSFLYDEHLRPASDLSDPGEVIDGAYTSPVLVQ